MIRERERGARRQRVRLLAALLPGLARLGQLRLRRLQDAPLDDAALARAKVKLRSELYDILEAFNGFGRADLLASLALFDDDPARINQIEPGLMALTPEVVQRTAREVLRPENRTVLVVQPKGGAK